MALLDRACPGIYGGLSVPIRPCGRSERLPSDPSIPRRQRKRSADPLRLHRRKGGRLVWNLDSRSKRARDEQSRSLCHRRVGRIPNSPSSSAPAGCTKKQGTQIPRIPRQKPQTQSQSSEGLIPNTPPHTHVEHRIRIRPHPLEEFNRSAALCLW